MFRFIKKLFVQFLTSIANESNHTKCVSLNIQQCMAQTTLLIYIQMNTVKNYVNINLQLIYRCAGSCDILSDLSNKVCVPNKTEDLNLSVFIMITGINGSKTLTRKHIS